MIGPGSDKNSKWPKNKNRRQLLFSQILEREGERFGHFCRKVLKFLSLAVLFATNRSCEHHDIQRDNRKRKVIKEGATSPPSASVQGT